MIRAPMIRALMIRALMIRALMIRDSGLRVLPSSALACAEVGVRFLH